MSEPSRRCVQSSRMTGEEGSQYYSALVVWLATLTGDQPDETEDVSDGVRMAKALHRLDPDKVRLSFNLSTQCY